MFIEIKQVVYGNFTDSFVEIEDFHEEFAVGQIAGCEDFTLVVLFNLFEFYVFVGFAAEGELKLFIMATGAVHFNIRLPLILLQNYYNSFGFDVVCNHDRNNFMLHNKYIFRY